MTPDRFLELAEVVARLDSPNVELQLRALESLRRQGVVWTKLTRELGFTLRGDPRPPEPKRKPPKKIARSATEKIPPLAVRLKARAERLRARAERAG